MSKIKDNNFVYKGFWGMVYDIFDSPVGEIKLCSDGTYLTSLVFTGQKYEDKHLGTAARGTCPVLESTKRWKRH